MWYLKETGLATKERKEEKTGGEQVIVEQEERIVEEHDLR